MSHDFYIADANYGNRSNGSPQVLQTTKVDALAQISVLPSGVDVNGTGHVFVAAGPIGGVPVGFADVTYDPVVDPDGAAAVASANSFMEANAVHIFSGAATPLT